MKKYTHHGLLLVITVFLLTACESTPVTDQPASIKSKITNSPADLIVTVLGSGTPTPSRTQFGAAILVQAGSEVLMFDCGRGCTTRLAQLNPKLINQVNGLFITHLHSDHIVGIDDLWLNGWTQGRNEALTVVGPQGTTDMMNNMAKTFAFDIGIRSRDGVPKTKNGISDAFTDLSDEGVTYERNGVKVTAFLVDHGTLEPAWGYRIDYRGRSVMISGDTTITKNLYTYGKDTDLILQEVLSPAMMDYINSLFDAKQVAKIVSYHTKASDAADLFKKSRPRLAVYYHTGANPASVESLIAETEKVYDGRTEVSHDLFQIRIGNEITTHDMSPKDQ